MKLLPSHHDVLVESEQGQSLVRFYAALVALAGYLFAAIASPSRDMTHAVACVLVYVGYSYAWLWLVAKGVGPVLLRQRAALVLDHLVYAACFAIGGRPVAALAWVAVTTSVGHGLRFGERRGIAAACIGSASMFAAVELGPGWQLPLPISAGMAVTALVVPLYVIRLVRTMTKQRREAEQRAQVFEQAAHTDALTGVLSRAGFYQRFAQMQQRTAAEGDKLGLVFMDLDGFKSINDTRGHDVGDIILREVARILGRVVRGSDAVARLGGDEFAIIVNAPASEDAVARVAEKAAAAIRSCQHEAAREAQLAASAGVAIVEPGGSVAEALKTADMRMFEVKRLAKQRRRQMA